MLDLKMLAPMFKGFLKNLQLSEVAVPADQLTGQFDAIAELVKSGQMEFRQVKEKKSGFTGYYLAKKGEPMLLPK